MLSCVCVLVVLRRDDAVRSKTTREGASQPGGDDMLAPRRLTPGLTNVGRVQDSREKYCGVKSKSAITHPGSVKLARPLFYVCELSSILLLGICSV